ncbi:MAG: VanZ family protein [Candidatus Faecousia sp.]|nr:VanZ family protein [Candidatus Faecousia sp.]
MSPLPALLPDYLALALLYVLLLPRWVKAGARSAVLHSALYLYCVVLLRLTLMPVLTALPHVGEFPYRPMLLEPFRDYVNHYGNATLQILLNVLLFVPFGVLYPMANRRGFFGVVLRGLCLSLLIELLQPLLSATRASDITDVIANTAGTAVGYLLYLPLGCLWPPAKSNR